MGQNPVSWGNPGTRKSGISGGVPGGPPGAPPGNFREIPGNSGEFRGNPGISGSGARIPDSGPESPISPRNPKISPSDFSFLYQYYIYLQVFLVYCNIQVLIWLVCMRYSSVCILNLNEMRRRRGNQQGLVQGSNEVISLSMNNLIMNVKVYKNFYTVNVK